VPTDADIDHRVFYEIASRANGVKPDSETARLFKWHVGEFEDGRAYMTLEYPVPSTF
jgi:hypothetical protein